MTAKKWESATQKNLDGYIHIFSFSFVKFTDSSKSQPGGH